MALESWPTPAPLGLRQAAGGARLPSPAPRVGELGLR